MSIEKQLLGVTWDTGPKKTQTEKIICLTIGFQFSLLYKHGLMHPASAVNQQFKRLTDETIADN